MDDLCRAGRHGERQRRGHAQADDDEQGERAFIEACAEALHGRTVILVTHRPATLALADRIVELEDGRIKEHPEGSMRRSRATA